MRNQPGGHSTDYGRYCRPRLADLLAATALDTTFVRASGSTLVDENGRAVTDFVGGFGAALLGHNPPELKRLAVELLEADTPVHAQVSNREAAGTLGARLSALMPGPSHYVAHLSNSGAEAVEAALKHAYMAHLDTVRRHFEQLARETNDLYHRIEGLAIDPLLPGGKRPLDFREDLDRHNIEQFEAFQKRPVVIAFLGSFHGLTSGAVKVTSNRSMREGFEGLSAIESEFVTPDVPERIREVVERRTCEFLRPVLSNGRVDLEPAPMSRVMACILEPIQGEGGVRPLPDATLAWLARHAEELRLPLIVDEVQTGCGRTGTFLAIESTPLAASQPAYILLSKALGGGLVKIAATMIRADILEPDFSIIHASTFGEDDLSCRIATRALDLVTADHGATLQRVLTKGDRLRTGLDALHARYPDVIREVRGRGLMQGLEFTELAGQSPFFRLAGRQGILSILIASYLLEHHGIRVLAPLTTLLKGNPGKVRRSVLRLQPPVVIDDAEIDRLTEALDEALAIVRANDEALLIGHLVGWSPTAEERRHPRVYTDAWPIESEHHDIDARTAFIVHPTSIADVRSYFFLSMADRPISDDRLERWWTAVARFLEPMHVRREVVTSRGFVLESNLVSVPYLPSALAGEALRRRRDEVRDKIQDAVTVARELGDENIPVTVVGLGGYTSIATRNGLTVNDHEVAITTGNAYTAALALEGVSRAARERGVDLGAARVAVVGAGGNIGEVLAVFLSTACASLVLVGSGREGAVDRLNATRLACRANASGASLAGPGGASARVAVISCSTDLSVLSTCDIVVVATSSPDPDLLTPDLLKPGAIVSCVSWPTNLSARLADQPRGITAFDGGFARLPEGSHLRFVGFPADGLAFGCLAETLLLGFEGHNHSFCKGGVTVDLVRRVIEIADRHGFRLHQGPPVATTVPHGAAA